MLLPDRRLRGADTHTSFVCNTFGVETSRHGDTLRVKRESTTENGCEPELMAFEQALFTVFDGDLTFKIRDEDGPGDNRSARLLLTNAEHDSISLTEDLADQGRLGPLTTTE